MSFTTKKTKPRGLAEAPVVFGRSGTGKSSVGSSAIGARPARTGSIDEGELADLFAQLGHKLRPRRGICSESRTAAEGTTLPHPLLAERRSLLQLDHM